MRIPDMPRVLLRHCDTYDPERIRTLVREGLDTLGLVPRGRTLVKPNLVAAGKLFPHAHTRPEFEEGVLRALQDRGAEMTELAVGERCGITLPTRLAYEQSGFDRMLARVPGVKRICFDEVCQVQVPLTHPSRLRDAIFVPEPVARADFFVNTPKFKAHPWTTVTFSLKSYIGLQDDRHRLIDHDHRLGEKIVDLHHVIQAQLIAIDAITAGQGRMLTPRPFPLNLVILGNAQVAFDAVCCAILGLDPRSVEHIRLAEDAGLGTTDLGRIEIGGDVTLDEAHARARGFEVGLVRVEKYFEGTKITAYAGPPPEPERTDYCWGGCPGAIEEAIEILRLFDAETDAKMPRLHIVFGAYDGPIDARPGEKVVFIGDCARWQGSLQGQDVALESVYVERDRKDPHHARAEDIYRKMLKVGARMRAAKDAPYVRLEGCPVSVAEQVLALVSLGGLKNPYFDPREVLAFNKAWMGWRARVAWQRTTGTPYQRPGPAARGDATPQLLAPSRAVS
ncbi:MAG: DUF362 domain-containing protein [Myxococcaceae bacterium]